MEITDCALAGSASAATAAKLEKAHANLLDIKRPPDEYPPIRDSGQVANLSISFYSGAGWQPAADWQSACRSAPIGPKEAPHPCGSPLCGAGWQPPANWHRPWPATVQGRQAVANPPQDAIKPHTGTPAAYVTISLTTSPRTSVSRSLRPRCM